MITPSSSYTTTLDGSTHDVIADVVDRLGSRAARQGASDQARAGVSLCARSSAHRRPARHGQDDALARPSARVGPFVQPHSVHKRRSAGRHRRRVGVRSRAELVPLRSGPGVCAGRSRRRGEPCNAEVAKRVARSDGGKAGHRRRTNAGAAGSVLRNCDAESRARRPARSRCRSRSSTAFSCVSKSAIPNPTRNGSC